MQNSGEKISILLFLPTNNSHKARPSFCLGEEDPMAKQQQLQYQEGTKEENASNVDF